LKRNVKSQLDVILAIQKDIRRIKQVLEGFDVLDGTWDRFRKEIVVEIT